MVCSYLILEERRVRRRLLSALQLLRAAGSSSRGLVRSTAVYSIPSCTSLCASCHSMAKRARPSRAAFLSRSHFIGSIFDRHHLRGGMPKAIAPARPVALAPIAVAAHPSASSSRTEARPQLRTTKDWVVPPRPKPGRKPAQAEPDSVSALIQLHEL